MARSCRRRSGAPSAPDRTCTGQDLALVVSKTVLATVVRKAELKVAQEEIRPVRNAYYYEPNKGLLVTLDRRV